MEKMPIQLISNERLTEIADAIREKTGDDALMTPTEMAEKISALPVPAFSYANRIITVTGEGLLTDGKMALGDYQFYYCDVDSVILDGSKISSIGKYAFATSSIQYLTIPKIAYEYAGSRADGGIGGYLCQGCEVLKWVRYYDKTVETEAFEGCRELTDVYLDDFTYKIKANAFKGCSRLKHIFIPSTVLTIDATSAATSPFSGCSSNLKIYTDATAKLSGWGTYFNNYSSSGKVTVNYGVSRAEYDVLYPWPES